MYREGGERKRRDTATETMQTKIDDTSDQVQRMQYPFGPGDRVVGHESEDASSISMEMVLREAAGVTTTHSVDGEAQYFEVVHPVTLYMAHGDPHDDAPYGQGLNIDPSTVTIDGTLYAVQVGTRVRFDNVPFLPSSYFVTHLAYRNKSFAIAEGLHDEPLRLEATNNQPYAATMKWDVLVAPENFYTVFRGDMQASLLPPSDDHPDGVSRKNHEKDHVTTEHFMNEYDEPEPGGSHRWLPPYSPTEMRGPVSHALLFGNMEFEVVARADAEDATHADFGKWPRYEWWGFQLINGVQYGDFVLVRDEGGTRFGNGPHLIRHKY